MTRTRWIAVVAALLLGLATLWYFASPALTLSRMRSAVEEGDGNALVAMIDFPALREDVKGEINRQVATAARRDPSAAGGIGGRFAPELLGPMIDLFLTPEMVRAALLARGPSAPGSKAELGRGLGLRFPEKPVIVRTGLSEFRLAPERDPASGLVFRREGLGWKLVGVELPAKDGN